MGGMTRATDFQGGLLCAALARCVPRRQRIFIFACGALIGIVFAAFAVVELLAAKDETIQMDWAAILGFALCAGLTHASIAYGFYARNGIALFLADVFMVAAFVMAMVSGTVFRWPIQFLDPARVRQHSHAMPISAHCHDHICDRALQHNDVDGKGDEGVMNTTVLLNAATEQIWFTHGQLGRIQAVAKPR
jgi:hypothetical protein